MAPDVIVSLFTHADGQFLCARWGRPVAPVIFGLSDETIVIFRAAFRAGFAHAGMPMVETDPEMGSNLMLFIVRDWDELATFPDLDHLTGRVGLPQRLAAEEADQYRLFRFDADGGIRACFMFVRLAGDLAELHPAMLAERLMIKSALSFAADVVPSDAVARLIRAAYDPVLPVMSNDPAHALRLAARME